MKKLSKFLGSVTLMVTMIFGVNTVKAFDSSSVNLSNEINFPWFISNGIIRISLDNDLKDNNSTINYQFISITEAELNSIMGTSDTISNNYSTCKSDAKTQNDYDAIAEQLKAEGKDYYSDETYRTTYNNYVVASNACVETYNNALAELYKSIPGFDNTKWKQQAISEETEYSVYYNVSESTDTQYYILWINAKDENNENIYNFAYKESSSYVEPEEPTTPEDSDTPIEPEEPTTPEEPKEDVEATVDNPNTGIYVSLGFVGLLFISLLAFGIFKKKSYFSKI